MNLISLEVYLLPLLPLLTLELELLRLDELLNPLEAAFLQLLEEDLVADLVLLNLVLVLGDLVAVLGEVVLGEVVLGALVLGAFVAFLAVDLVLGAFPPLDPL